MRTPTHALPCSPTHIVPLLVPYVLKHTNLTRTSASLCCKFLNLMHAVPAPFPPLPPCRRQRERSRLQTGCSWRRRSTWSRPPSPSPRTRRSSALLQRSGRPTTRCRSDWVSGRCTLSGRLQKRCSRPTAECRKGKSAGGRAAYERVQTSGCCLLACCA